MSNIIASLSLLGYCLFLRRFTRWPIEAAPFFLISVTIVFLYVFAYIDILNIGALIFLITGGFALCIAPFYLPKNRQELFENYFTPGLIIYIVFMILFGMMAIYVVNTVAGDDIGRWMPHAKLLYLNKGFVKVNDTVSNPDYPPGGALFYYFLSQLTNFKEENIFFAQLFFLFAPLVILLKPFRWKHWAIGCLVFAIILKTLHNRLFLPFGNGATVLMDSPTGTFFGGLLASYILMSEKPKMWIYLLFPAMAMVLFKPMVYAFVALTGTVILVDQFILRRALSRNASDPVNNEKRTPWFLFLFLLIVPGLMLFSWQYHIKQAGMPVTFNLFNVLTDFFHKSSVLNADEHKIVIHKYHFEFKHTKHFALDMIYYVLALLLCIKDKLSRVRIATTHLILLLGYLLYSYMLLIFYLYEMDPVAATALNSYQRFMLVYDTAWFIVLIAHLVDLVAQPALTLLYQNKPLTSIGLAIFEEFIKPGFNYLQNNLPKIFYVSLIIFAVNYATKGLYYHKENHKYFAEKKGFRYVTHAANDIAISIQQKIGNQAKIGIIGGNLVPLFSYELIPNFSYALYEDLGSSENFESIVKQYDYLVIANATHVFWQHYGQYFLLPERKSFAKLILCKGPNPYVPWDCVHRLAPIYLYKVEKNDGKLFLHNLA